MNVARWFVVATLMLIGVVLGGSLESDIGRPLGLLVAGVFGLAACVVMDWELLRTEQRRPRTKQ